MPKISLTLSQSFKPDAALKIPKFGTPVSIVFGPPIAAADYDDPAAGKYSAQALAAVRLGGVATALSLAGFIGLSRWRETRRPPTRS